MASEPPLGATPPVKLEPISEAQSATTTPISPEEQPKLSREEPIKDQEEKKPPPTPRRDVNQEYVEQIHRFDPQGAIYHDDQGSDYVSEETVMQHTIVNLLEEKLIEGPIRSALRGFGYHQPHQIVLCEPQFLSTNRTTSGEYSEDDIPLPPHIVHTWHLLQAYHNTYLMGKEENDGNF